MLTAREDREPPSPTPVAWGWAGTQGQGRGQTPPAPRVPVPVGGSDHAQASPGVPLLLVSHGRGRTSSSHFPGKCCVTSSPLPSVTSRQLHGEQNALMETFSSTFLPLLWTVTSLLSGTYCSPYVRVPTILHGTYGHSLLLPVEDFVHSEDVEIYFSWNFRGPTQDMPTLLVAFQNQKDINMDKSRFSFQPPNASLLIHSLDQTMEGEYWLAFTFSHGSHFPTDLVTLLNGLRSKALYN
ncbi:hypothetical protein ANANG_G00179650 [Anguilla anguilla]|uniref:Immunoglobulin V-set domain-containing protein n=1 Tax=Anguilla anguilla TaxID=7936 RepID=A0A9D3M519_ANGAN|nr:hypothetical protein ANANG_G00179650 [Anguilla anguilla]